VHRPDFYNMANLFALEYAISSSASHARNIKKLGSVYHVVI
jgi:hypothetical protein